MRSALTRRILFVFGLYCGAFASRVLIATHGGEPLWHASRRSRDLRLSAPCRQKMWQRVAPANNPARCINHGLLDIYNQTIELRTAGVVPGSRPFSHILAGL